VKATLATIQGTLERAGVLFAMMIVEPGRISGIAALVSQNLA
jgi:hypothetical protein